MTSEDREPRRCQTFFFSPFFAASTILQAIDVVMKYHHPYFYFRVCFVFNTYLFYEKSGYIKGTYKRD